MHELIGYGITGLVALVTSGALFGLLTLRPTRRKMAADTDVVLSDSAVARMTKAETKADAAEARVDRLELEMQKMRRKFYAYELWADQHRSWDEEAQAEVQHLGGRLRPPPQLVTLNDG